jgi:hypothetical protein
MDFIEFFRSGAWWPTFVGILVAGTLVGGFLEYFNNILLGIFFGIILAITDLIIGEKLGYSFIEIVSGWIEDLFEWIKELFN